MHEMSFTRGWIPNSCQENLRSAIELLVKYVYACTFDLYMLHALVKSVAGSHQSFTYRKSHKLVRDTLMDGYMFSSSMESVKI